MDSSDPRTTNVTSSGSDYGHYGRVAATLHWIVALLVLFMLGLGFYMVDVPRQTPLRAALFNFHKSIGLVMLALMILRSWWRVGHRPPPLSGLGRLNFALARSVHWLLYLFLLIQPIAGYVASSLGRYGVTFFGIELPAWTSPNPDLREIFLSVHRMVARILVALILVHLCGTSLHIVQGRSTLVRRMLPWRS